MEFMSHHRLKHKISSNPKRKNVQDIGKPITHSDERLRMWRAPRRAFRFFDLSQEIQNLVYEVYFSGSVYLLENVCSECAEEGFEKHECLYKAKLSGNVPSLQHELACRRMAKDSRTIRDLVCPTSLTFIEKVETEGLGRQFATDPKYEWLRQRLTSLTCRGVTQFAINQTIHWSLLTTHCPNLSIINIEVRKRHDVVYWRANYIHHALQENPDHQNVFGLNLDDLHVTAEILQRRTDNYTIRVQSSHWWPISTKDHKNCFTQIVNYEVTADGLKTVSRVYELANMEAAKERLRIPNFFDTYYNIRSNGNKDL